MAEKALTIEGRAYRLFNNAVNNSKLRGHPRPTMTRTEIEVALRRGVCAVTGLKFDFTPTKKGRPHPYAPSIDRPDNSKPYSRTNFRVVLWAVNIGCMDWGMKTYLQIAAAALGVQGPL